MKFDPAKEIKLNSTDEMIEAMTYVIQHHIREAKFDMASSINVEGTFELFKNSRSAYFPMVESFGMSRQMFFGRVKGTFTVKYTIGKVKFDMMATELDKEIVRIRKMLFLPGMPPEAKVYLAHNYVASAAVYVNQDINDVGRSYCHSAYGCLIKHECVCQGYADAFDRIITPENIPCNMIYGRFTGPEGAGGLHGWNSVKLGMQNYLLDMTADRGSSPRFERFCKTDTDFERAGYSWNKAVFPVCNGKEDILGIARQYVKEHKNELKAAGVSDAVLGISSLGSLFGF